MFALQANAAVINFTNDGNGQDDPFSFIGNNNPVTVFGWLEGELLSWNNHVANPLLPDPTPFLSTWKDLNGVPPTINVAAGDYIALHYGEGAGGSPGGGFVALYFDANQSFTPAAMGSGPNGNGGISTVYLWDHALQVPEGGASVMLLSGALATLGLIRRKLSS